jgi:hypothetical protein
MLVFEYLSNAEYFEDLSNVEDVKLDFFRKSNLPKLSSVAIIGLGLGYN